MVDWDREYLSTRGIGVKLPLRSGFGRTDRIDGWWKGPTAMAAYLGIMILYSTWRGMMEADFWIFENFGRSAGYSTMAIESEGTLGRPERANAQARGHPCARKPTECLNPRDLGRIQMGPTA